MGEETSSSKNNGSSNKSDLANKPETLNALGSEKDGTKYFRTTEALVDHVGVEHGRHMRGLVRDGKEPEFKEPTEPTAKTSGTRSSKESTDEPVKDRGELGSGTDITMRSGQRELMSLKNRRLVFLP